MAKLLFKSQRGFTLLEILVAMGIFLLVLFVVTTFGLDVATFGGFLGENLNSQHELQQAFKQMRSEIRSLGPASNGSYSVESATAISFVFFSNIDNDNLFERVRYFLDGTTLKRGVIEPTGDPLVYLLADEQIREVAHNIVNDPAVIFSYYPQEASGEGVPLVFPVDQTMVHLVKISLTVDADPLQLPAPTSLAMTVALRNFR